MRKILGLTLIAGGAMLAAPLSEANAASLRGSPAAMVEQNRVAKDHGLAFFRIPDDIRTAVSRGELEELTGNDDYAVADFVSFPYLQPAVKLFVERLAAQYREACGQKLVVTSAVRPSSGQPRNAHALSVHPAGMAVDLRVSDRASCRDWLESALLGLEGQGVINGIREFHPPHYHVAVYPEQYLAYVGPRIEAERQAAEKAERERAREQALATRALAAVPGAAALVTPEAVPEESEEPRRALAGMLVILFAIPVGLGLAARRFVKRG
jgi:hypothetical protein